MCLQQLSSAVVTYWDVGALRTEGAKLPSEGGAEQEVTIHLRTNVFQVSLGN